MGRWSYWIKSGFFHSLYILLASFFYGIFVAIVSNNFTLHEIAVTTYEYANIMGSIMLVILNVTKIPFITNTILSFGETRKNCVKGITLMNDTTIIVNAFVSTLFGLLAYRNIIVLFNTLIMLPSVNLLANGLGLLICSIKKTLSTTADGLKTLLMILAVPFVCVLSFITTIPLDETNEYKNAFIQILIIFNLILGLILTIAGTCLFKKRVMQLEVKL